MDLKEVFNAIGSQMLSDFSSLHSQIKHLGERGSEREQGLKSFLDAYLPAQYAVANGEIVDDSGAVSRQCDLVIYDKSKCPLLLAGKEYRVFPAEPVYAVVEVKSVLTPNELKDSLEKIHAIKRLKRENGSIAGVVFAYKSGRKNNSMKQIANQLQEFNSGVDPHLYADLICILDSGLIKQQSAARRMEVFLELSIPVLLFFFVSLLDVLDHQVARAPEYLRYAHSIEIGLVQLQDASARDTDDEHSAG